jgi:hypothetical protein
MDFARIASARLVGSGRDHELTRETANTKKIVARLPQGADNDRVLCLVRTRDAHERRDA